MTLTEDEEVDEDQTEPEAANPLIDALFEQLEELRIKVIQAHSYAGRY